MNECRYLRTSIAYVTGIKIVIYMACTRCQGADSCNAFFLPLNDLMSILNGKWKIRIILCLASEPKRFNEIKKYHNISPRILSKELKELEANEIISRAELGDSLKSVQYSLAELGKELIPIIIQLQKWGEIHRSRIIGKRRINA